MARSGAGGPAGVPIRLIDLNRRAVRRMVIEVHENLTAPFGNVDKVVRRRRPAFQAQPGSRSVGTLFALVIPD
jgi:hypothetical protein